MSTAPTLTIDGVNQLPYVQHRSMTAKRTSVELILVNPTQDAALGDALVMTYPTWTGTVCLLESKTYGSAGRYLKVQANAPDVIPDSGAAPFGLSDAPNGSTTRGFRDLVVKRTLVDSVAEVRATCKVFVEGLEPGMEIAVTSVLEGLDADTFTIMDVTTFWPAAGGAVYTIDMGIGDYDASMIGRADGGPLTQPTLVQIIRQECCDRVFSDVTIDSFDGRTEASGWGTASGGSVWDAGGIGATTTVGSGMGTSEWGGDTSFFSAISAYALPTSAEVLWRWRIRTGAPAGTDITLMGCALLAEHGTPSDSTWYFSRCVQTATTGYIRTWVDGTTEPGTWDSTEPISSPSDVRFVTSVEDYAIIDVDYVIHVDGETV